MNIKGLAACALIIAAMTSCSGKKDGTGTYTLTVDIEDQSNNGTQAVLLSFDTNEKIDSTTIADGKAVFTGSIDEPKVVEVIFNGSKGYRFILEEGNTEYKNGRAISDLNDRFQAFRQDYIARYDSVNKLIQQAVDEAEKEALVNAARLHLDSVMSKAMIDNIYNPIGYMLTIDRASNMESDKFIELMKQYPHLAKYKRIDDIKKYHEAREATSAGKQYTDFEVNQNGETVKLSDYVKPGQYTLVDFWASWCGPCRREMPNIVEAYAKYKGKNFEIVGVSLDQDADKWKDAIKKLNITWPQMSDLKGWQNEGAQLYAVNSIPHTMLVDADGTILARGLHGEKLQTKLEEVLNK